MEAMYIIGCKLNERKTLEWSRLAMDELSEAEHEWTLRLSDFWQYVCPSDGKAMTFHTSFCDRPPFLASVKKEKSDGVRLVKKYGNMLHMLHMS